MKKFLAICTAVAIFQACGSGDSNSDESTSSSSALGASSALESSSPGLASSASDTNSVSVSSSSITLGPFKAVPNEDSLKIDIYNVPGNNYLTVDNYPYIEYEVRKANNIGSNKMTGSDAWIYELNKGYCNGAYTMYVISYTADQQISYHDSTTFTLSKGTNCVPSSSSLELSSSSN